MEKQEVLGDLDVCEYCGGKKSRAMIRTKTVCRSCFTLFQQDNKLRCIKNIEISDELILLKKGLI